MHWWLGLCLDVVDVKKGDEDAHHLLLENSFDFFGDDNRRHVCDGEGNGDLYTPLTLSISSEMTTAGTFAKARVTEISTHLLPFRFLRR